MSLHSDIVKILNDEGAASEGGWHSWRCFDKDRYPEPCECTEVVASMVISAALDAAREAVDRVASDMANWSSAETTAATSAIPDLNVDQWIWAQRGVHRAIAAIDALRIDTPKQQVMEHINLAVVEDA